MENNTKGPALLMKMINGRREYFSLVCGFNFFVIL